MHCAPKKGRDILEKFSLKLPQRKKKVMVIKYDFWLFKKILLYEIANYTRMPPK